MRSQKSGNHSEREFWNILKFKIWLLRFRLWNGEHFRNSFPEQLSDRPELGKWRISWIQKHSLDSLHMNSTKWWSSRSSYCQIKLTSYCEHSEVKAEIGDRKELKNYSRTMAIGPERCRMAKLTVCTFWLEIFRRFLRRFRLSNSTNSKTFENFERFL